MDELQEYIAYNVPDGSIKLEEIRVLKGANYFSGAPVVRFRIFLDGYDEVFSNQIPKFYEKLKSGMPTLYEHHCSVGRIGGFFERVKEGTLLGHIMEHIAIEFQHLAGMDVGFGKTRETKRKGVYNVVFRFFDEIAGIYAGKAAINFINHLLEDKPFNNQKIVDNLVIIREKRLLGPSTQAIVDEAKRRKIPVIRIDKFNQVQLGTGKYRKNIRATITDETGLIAVETTDDKFLTNNLLSEAGISVPSQIITENLTDVLKFHSDIKKPIVIKPAHGYQGKRVSIDLNNDTNIIKAFIWAKEFDQEVIAQEDILGGTYRLLVINYKFCAAVRQVPAYIVGDGKTAIGELITKLNDEPEREFGDKGTISKVTVDEDTLKILELRNLCLEDILPVNEIVYLKNSGNMRLGATSIDMTDNVHPFNKFIAERIAKILKLNVAGIDILTEDIKIPMNQNNGKIIEVNAAPDFRVHFNPTVGIKRYVQRDFVNMLFPSNSISSIPIYSVTGSFGKSLTVDLINFCLKTKGFINGIISSNGLYINDFCICPEDSTPSKNVQIVLKDPTIDCAIFETPVEAILENGLGYETANFGIMLNISTDKTEYFNFDHIRDINDLSYAKSVVLEQIADDGFAIMNADNSTIMEMRQRVIGKIVLFSKSENNQKFYKHITNGGYGTAIKNDMLFVYDKGTEFAVMSIDEVSFISQIMDNFKYDVLLSSLAALYFSGLTIEDIRNCLINYKIKNN